MTHDELKLGIELWSSAVYAFFSLSLDIDFWWDKKEWMKRCGGESCQQLWICVSQNPPPRPALEGPRCAKVQKSRWLSVSLTVLGRGMQAPSLKITPPLSTNSIHEGYSVTDNNLCIYLSDIFLLEVISHSCLHTLSKNILPATTKWTMMTISFLGAIYYLSKPFIFYTIAWKATLFPQELCPGSRWSKDPLIVCCEQTKKKRRSKKEPRKLALIPLFWSRIAGF